MSSEGSDLGQTAQQKKEGPPMEKPGVWWWGVVGSSIAHARTEDTRMPLPDRIKNQTGFSCSVSPNQNQNQQCARPRENQDTQLLTRVFLPRRAPGAAAGDLQQTSLRG